MSLSRNREIFLPWYLASSQLSLADFRGCTSSVNCYLSFSLLIEFFVFLALSSYFRFLSPLWPVCRDVRQTSLVTSSG